MAYRTLTIDDQQYQFVIGKQFVKFRGGEAVPHARIGWPIKNSEEFMVTPGTIREYLTTGQVETGPRHCNNHTNPYRKCPNMVSALQVLPYDAEICGKYHYMFLCDDCIARNAEDI